MAMNRGEALYPSLMGAEWNNLEARLQRFHSEATPRRGAGIFQIRHGGGRLARALAWLLRMPREGKDVCARLLVCDGDHSAVGKASAEVWERSFAGQTFTSFQSANPQGLLAERIALIELWFRLEASNHSLVFVPAGAALALGRIRMRIPPRLCPMVRGRVSASDEFSQRFTVSVSLALPVFGLVLAYEGFIEPEVANP